jgi:pimeloyl-ACP methyl ester carboxylesterase
MNNQQMVINEDKVKRYIKPSQGRRGLRYYLLVLALVAWGIIFLLTASAALTRLSPLAFLGTAILLYIGLILRNVYRSLNPVRTPVLSNPLSQIGVDYEDVVFSSRDGWPLSGWFIPSKRGPTVILTHGLGGNRLDLMPAASLLIEKGFGVLMYDMRAHGRSSGNMGTWGWLEINDLNGAVDYLLERQDVAPDQIGAIGFSLGGQVTIRAAAENSSIRAVIAEDPSPAVLADHPIPPGFSWRKMINLPGIWLVYHLEKAVSGLQEPPGILASIGKISPRPLLLVASGEGRGVDLMHTFFEQANEPKDFWQVPEAGHGWISVRRPEEYQQQLCGFFERYLLGDEIIEYT